MTRLSRLLPAIAIVFGFVSLRPSAAPQQAGTITGTVLSAQTGAGVAGASVSFRTPAGDAAGYTLTNAVGFYTSPGLAPGTYYVTVMTTSALVSELFDNVPCPGGGCGVSAGTPVLVEAAVTTQNIDFELAQGGRIAGTVTNEATAEPVGNVIIRFYTSTGVPAGQVVTDSVGGYLSAGLPTGIYYLEAFVPRGLGLMDEWYSNISCVGVPCSVTMGTPVPVTAPETTTNIDFTLTPGGTIAGTVTNASSGQPLSQVRVDFFAGNGLSAGATATDANGEYVSPGLPAGSYFVRTTTPPVEGLIDELYDDVPCPGGACTVTGGSAVAITGTATIGGVDFVLGAGGSIGGRVTSSETGQGVYGAAIFFYTASGAYAGHEYADADGDYTSPGLPPGSYYVRTYTTHQSGLLDELYSDIPCPNQQCTVTDGAPVRITTSATTTGIDFALPPGGRISGTLVNAATGAPLPNEYVHFYSNTGGYVAVALTDAQGDYLSPGMPTGIYFVRTDVGVTPGPALIDELFDGVPCPGRACVATTGTPVAVTAPATRAGVDFALDFWYLSGNLAFADVAVGAAATRTLTIVNGGSSPLTIGSISYPAGFSGPWSGDIPAGGSQNVSVLFAPTEVMAYGGVITVTAEQSLEAKTIAVSGRGVLCSWVLTPASQATWAQAANGSVSITTQERCGWMVESDAAWLTVTSPMAGSGPQTLAFADEPNPAPTSRVGHLTIGGQTATIAQSGSDSVWLWWQHQATGALAMWLMDGTVRSALSSVGSVADTNWRIVGTGDMNGDGHADLLWQHQGDGRIAAWVMIGDRTQYGMLLTPQLVSDLNWRIKGVADFNQDGHDDLLWQHRTDGRIAVWLMHGTSSTAGIVIARMTNPSWTIVAAADLNADGQPDIVWQNDADGRLAAWLMSGLTVTATPPLSPTLVADLHWKVRGAADVDADGQTDLLWQHETDGRVAAWLMDGIALRTGVLLQPGRVDDLAWRVAGAK